MWRYTRVQGGNHIPLLKFSLIKYDFTLTDLFDRRGSDKSRIVSWYFSLIICYTHADVTCKSDYRFSLTYIFYLKTNLLRNERTNRRQGLSTSPNSSHLKWPIVSLKISVLWSRFKIKTVNDRPTDIRSSNWRHEVEGVDMLLLLL